jgi:hypothetical protein
LEKEKILSLFSKTFSQKKRDKKRGRNKKEKEQERMIKAIAKSKEHKKNLSEMPKVFS